MCYKVFLEVEGFSRLRDPTSSRSGVYGRGRGLRRDEKRNPNKRKGIDGGKIRKTKG